MIVIGVLVDTLQPPHLGVKQAFDYISKSRNPQYAFIVVTDKKQSNQSDITQPLNRRDKEQILIRHGIPKGVLVTGHSPFDTSELEKRFDPSDTAIVFYFFSNRTNTGIENDRVRPWSESYVTNPSLQSQLKPMNEMVYYQLLNNSIKNVKGLNLTTKLFIEELGNPQATEDNKKTFFALAFGWYDSGLYNLIKERFRAPYEKFISKYASAVSQPSLEKSIREIAKILTNDLAAMLDEENMPTDPPTIPGSDPSKDGKLPGEKLKDKEDDRKKFNMWQTNLNLKKERDKKNADLNRRTTRELEKTRNKAKMAVVTGKELPDLPSSI